MHASSKANRFTVFVREEAPYLFFRLIARELAKTLPQELVQARPDLFPSCEGIQILKKFGENFRGVGDSEEARLTCINLYHLHLRLQAKLDARRLARQFLTGTKENRGNWNALGASAELEAIITFLSRWYLSLESLTAIATSGLVTGKCVTQDATLGTISEPGQLALDACDDYFGFPTRLALLFREIGASAWERRQQLPVIPLGATSFLTQTDFDLVADDFHRRLTEIYHEFVCSPVGLNFYPGVREALSENEVRDLRPRLKPTLPWLASWWRGDKLNHTITWSLTSNRHDASPVRCRL
ncbi:hypothetical protein CEP54_007016 [Fusarium duplospermum]|uniref:Uncharacterized protein n=1 Tax=Fusarium duplospermum TaxID=1325734 RepID=A0A428Q3R3_9HYPO|nr:hypothetical protein CEP54_007016 [Fusarium duplospermum]